MEYRVEVDSQLPIVVVTTSGRPEADQFVAYAVDAAQVLAETGLDRLLIDYRGMEPGFAHARTVEVTRNAESMARFREQLERVRMATVVDATANFGIIRMWEALVESQDIRLCHRTFYDIDQARAWLMGSDDP